MRPIPFDRLMDWILSEYAEHKTIFGVQKFWKPTENKYYEIFGERLEAPFGPAAGPHTQLAQNIVAGYAAGGRFFELKTVQKLDGRDLPVSKPCIHAEDECYNVEWSTELYVNEAFEEYVKGWFALKLISREFGFGDENGFIFNMSVGYDLDGIRLKKIDDYIEGMKEAKHTKIWAECTGWAKSNIHRFRNIDEAYIDGISSNVSRSITLSTLHGCPPDEIERIAAYLIAEKKLHTFVKCNPTLLDYEYARSALDSLGFGYVRFDGRHFGADLQFADAVPMLGRLMSLAGEEGLLFGVKLTNTFPVKITQNELPGDEMYMSGRALFPLSMAVAAKLSEAFGGKLRISYSGGADVYNIGRIVEAGIWPVTLATTLLKPGGYNRLKQISEALAPQEYRPFAGVDSGRLRAILDDIKPDPHYRKPVKPVPMRKINKKVPLVDCFTAPCRDGCPINQDIPAYLRLAGEGRYLEALRVIVERNPLPFITGTICPHRCTDKCARAFYEEPVHIRGVKLETANAAYFELMKEIWKPEPTKGKAAIIGGGPAGLSAAYFLVRAGFSVTVFEKRASLGGIVRHVIPGFRISGEAIDKDVGLVSAYGVGFVMNTEIKSIAELQDKGFVNVMVATGAWKPGRLELKKGKAVNVIELLDALKNRPETVSLGKNVAVIGGGNTAVDAARAAKRTQGVEKVSLVYRRDMRNMPADEEELELAVADGVEFCGLLSPVSHENGLLKCEKMKLGEPDTSGRGRPVPTGKIVEIPADTVVSAIGEHVDTHFYKENNIKTDGKGMAIVDENFETNLSGVYVIGDAARGPATVAQAIADAAKAAEAITKAHYERYNRLNINPLPEIPMAKKGVLYPDTSKTTEPERCLECATVCVLCADVCPNRANVAVMLGKRPQIVHIDYMCNECGNCETFCPYDSAPYRDKFTLFGNEEDFANSENEGFLPLGGNKVRIRLGGEVSKHSLSDDILPDDISGLIRAVIEKYTYI